MHNTQMMTKIDLNILPHTQDIRTTGNKFSSPIIIKVVWLSIRNTDDCRVWSENLSMAAEVVTTDRTAVLLHMHWQADTSYFT